VVYTFAEVDESTGQLRTTGELYWARASYADDVLTDCN